MDNKFIHDNGLEEATRRFQQILEYTFYDNTANGMVEAGEDDNEDDSAPATEPAGNGQTAPNADMNPPAGNQDDNVPTLNTDAQATEPAGNGQDNAPAPDPEGEPEIDPEDDDMDDEDGEDDDLDFGDDEEDDDEGEGEDEVIDVDDLVDAQETSEYKIDGVSEVLTKLLNVVGKFEKAIQSNDDKIMDLKHEMERRNPTPEEKINLRSVSSKPFNMKPEAYWTDVKKNDPNYNIFSDNSVAPNKEQEYTVTTDDMKNLDNRTLASSIDNYPKSLKDYFA